ncbi:MAG: DUF2892 domain-containing protein [Candidatus Saccharimonadales bacterium]
MGFAKFMSSVWGRLLRVVAGLAIMYVGYFVVTGVLGYVIMAVGALPLIAGIFDFCIFAPLFGGPFKGSEARK